MTNLVYRVLKEERETFLCCGCCTSGFWDGIKAVLGHAAYRELQEASYWAMRYESEHGHMPDKYECQRYIEKNPESVLYVLQVDNHL